MDACDNNLDGMYLPIEKAEMVLKLLLERNSVSNVERITEVHKATIIRLLVLAGEKCERIMAEKVRNVRGPSFGVARLSGLSVLALRSA